MRQNILWLAYRKLRPALGIPFAFVLVSGAFIGVLDYRLILAAFGLLLIDLFGNFYNDYWDFEEDMRNKRRDKFTAASIISAKTALRMSVIFALAGLALLMYISEYLALLGGLLAFLLFAYSHKSIRLKGRLAGYAMSFPYFFIPLAIARSFGQPFPAAAIPLSFFFYFQCMYILCQKDSTDTKEKDNLFVNTGWAGSFLITSFFAVMSSLALLAVSVANILVFPAWALSVAAKAKNLQHIGKRAITREKRSGFVLAEFISHYLFFSGLLLFG